MPSTKRLWWIAALLVVVVPLLLQAQTPDTLDARTREALLAALGDERKAQASYRSTMEKHGDVMPFARIVEAEERHEAHLLELFEAYGLDVPADPYAGQVMAVAATLKETCAQAAEWEKENAAMYDGFLEFVKEADVRAVFQRLGEVSRERHLLAFERCAGDGGPGRMGGMGTGMGRGMRGEGHGGGCGMKKMQAEAKGQGPQGGHGQHGMKKEGGQGGGCGCRRGPAR